MIPPKLKAKILPYFLMDINKRYHDDVDKYFSEVYLIHRKKGVGLIGIRCPDPPYLCFLYNALNGAFEEVDMWDIVKKEGTQL